MSRRGTLASFVCAQIGWHVRVWLRLWYGAHQSYEGVLEGVVYLSLAHSIPLRDGVFRACVFHLGGVGFCLLVLV